MKLENTDKWHSRALTHSERATAIDPDASVIMPGTEEECQATECMEPPCYCDFEEGLD